MWDETYSVFIDDKHGLAMREYFEGKNPYALQDMTSVMLETARKGYWTPSEQVLQKLAQVHAELVAKFGAACSYETCGNRKLQEYLNAQLVAPGSDMPADVLDAYAASLAAVLQPATPPPDVEGIELEERIEQVTEHEPVPRPVQTALLAGGIVLSVLAMLAIDTRGSRTKGL